MEPEGNRFQQYFSSHRKTFPRRLASASVSLGLWSRSKSSLRAAQSTVELVQTRPEPEMESPAPTTNGHDTPAPEPPTSSFDPALFRSYLLALLPPVIGALPEELETLFDAEFDERVTRFAAEGGNVIYVVKSKDDVEGELVSTSRCLLLETSFGFSAFEVATFAVSDFHFYRGCTTYLHLYPDPTPFIPTVSRSHSRAH